MSDFNFSGEFTGSSALQSKCIFYKSSADETHNIISCAITLYFADGLCYFYVGVSSDPDVAPITWERVDLVSGIEKTYTLVNVGDALFYRFDKDGITTIATQRDALGNKIAPALRIRNVVTS